jgi:hypothetical protein
MTGKIDTSEIAEVTGFRALKRDANGVLPRRESMIRDAVDQRRKQLGLTAYRLWKRALPFHANLSKAAVSEFLKGQRQLELPSAEALLAAVGLRVVVAVKGNQATTMGLSKKRVSGSRHPKSHAKKRGR